MNMHRTPHLTSTCCPLLHVHDPDAVPRLRVDSCLGGSFRSYIVEVSALACLL